MAENNYSFENKGLFENIEKLAEEAKSGNNDAVQRLEAITKLANPIFDFSASDYRRILDKQLPLPVRKGIQLYKMMSELIYLVQPVGKRKGTACGVRRIDYENLTWEEFLELRGSFRAGFIMDAIKQRAEPKFSGLGMLNENQKELYQRIKVYFGNKKKPTLQSLAMNLLSEETDGKDFSERSLYIYLEAINEHQKRRKKASGFDILSYVTFRSVATFHNEKTIRESLEDWDKTMATMTASIYKMLPEISANLLASVSANLLKDIIPKVNENLMSQFYQNLMPQFQTSQMSKLIGSIIPNISSLQALYQNEDSD